MNSYRQSDGTRILKSVLDRKVREAKAKKLEQQKDEFGYNFCETIDCHKSTGIRLDCAHIISVKKCQEMGKSELAFDVNNIGILCRECHQKYDKLNVQFQTV